MDLGEVEEALAAQWRGQCYLGAVKTNFGHLEAAASAAGAMKMILSLRNRNIPGLFSNIQPAFLASLTDGDVAVLRRIVHPLYHGRAVQLARCRTGHSRTTGWVALQQRYRSAVCIEKSRAIQFE